MQAVGRHVIVEPCKERTKSGLIVAGGGIDHGGNTPIEAIIVSVGVDIIDADRRVAGAGTVPDFRSELKPGMRIVCVPFAPGDLKEYGYLVLRYDLILAIVEDADEARKAEVLEKRQGDHDKTSGGAFQENSRQLRSVLHTT